MKLPALVIGKTYRHAEVKEYMSFNRSNDGLPGLEFDDYQLASHGRFPSSHRSGEWCYDSSLWRKNESPVIEYLNIEMPVIWELNAADLERHLTVDTIPGRVERIEQIIKDGGIALPVWAQKYDPKYRVLEGKHRLSAFHRLGIPMVPMFLIKYESWGEDPPSLE
jgi:hypothetical protein